MLRIITDNASDITLDQARELDVELISLGIHFEDGDCPQRKDEDFTTFYDRLVKCDKLPVTSRPAPQAYLDIYLDAKAKGEEVLVLTLSSGLSGTIESAHEAKRQAAYEKIHIVDTHQAIIAQRLLVEMAVRMRGEEYTAAEIAHKIEQVRDQVVVCGVVDTLKYLRKGGRIPASLAMLCTALRIKPVIALEDTTLKTIGKARGHSQGVKMLYDRMKKDHFSKAYPVYFGYTTNREQAVAFMQKTKEQFGIINARLFPVGGIIGTLCGTNCVVVAYFKGC